MNNVLAFSDVLQTILGIVVALLVLLLTITVHELGHYIVGKLLKFKITEFAIGMGPAIFKKVKKNGEIFSVRLLPLGGFCAFEGEDDAGAPGKEKVKKDDKKSENDSLAIAEPTDAAPALSENAFNNKKPWQRILVLLAGGVTNIIFAVVIIAVTFSIYGHFTLTPSEIIPAAETLNMAYSLESGDQILEIDDKYIYMTTDFSDALNGKKKGDMVDVVVMRNGEKVSQKIVLRNDVTSSSMTDYYSAFEALGVGTTLIVKAGSGCVFPDNAYLVGRGDGARIYSLTDLYGYLGAYHDGEQVTFTVKIDDEQKLISVTIPEGFDELNTDYAALDTEGKKQQNTRLKEFFKIDGYYITYAISSQNVKLGFFEGLYRAPMYGLKSMWITLRSIGGLFNGTVSVSDISGPVGTISITSQYVRMGFNYVLEIMALIGISIGVFNLLPIPALDGGRIVFVIIEWIRGKPINRNIEGRIHFVGIIVLLAFAIIVDLLKLF